MISLSDLKLIFDGTLSMLKAIKENNNHNNVEYEVALLEIYTATTETKKLYIFSWKEKKTCKRKRTSIIRTMD
jgi:hypothetical protein